MQIETQQIFISDHKSAIYHQVRYISRNERIIKLVVKISYKHLDKQDIHHIAIMFV